MPRRAVVAVGVSQLMVDLALLVYDHEPYKQEYFGAALEQMFVALVIFSAAEGAGQPLTVADVSKTLGVPYSNVHPHLKSFGAE
ncbi:hypothetical protein [Bradyrhizobium elkanii]|uniref:hypothetical protein n=1 Tax=Bradyrhizobium elkanii TaxID=29448 RepID=UPI000485C363|nr:hypothetical protein [Bradyrhizobium elkanii]